MGRTSDEEGESSTRICDSESSDERPLKKARYIWQIKGKYHLKKPEDEDKDIMKHTVCESDAVDETDGYATLEVECSKSEIEEEQKESVATPVIIENNTAEQEVEMVTPCSADYVNQLADAFSNWELRKWQDRQIARSFVDNTINRVLEVMGFVPLAFDAEDISDEEFSIPNNENDEDVEDEAVLMAIHSHGLQRSEHEAQDIQMQQCCDGDKISVVPCICSQPASGTTKAQNLNPFHQRPVLTHLVDHDQPGHTGTNRSTENISPDLPSSSTVVLKNTSSSSKVPNTQFENVTDEMLNTSLLVTNMSESCSEKTTDPNLKSNSVSRNIQSETNKDNRSSTFYEHNDFLDQAVGVAIQKKGLSTLSCLEFG